VFYVNSMRNAKHYNFLACPSWEHERPLSCAINVRLVLATVSSLTSAADSPSELGYFTDYCSPFTPPFNPVTGLLPLQPAMPSRPFSLSAASPTTGSAPRTPLSIIAFRLSCLQSRYSEAWSSGLMNSTISVAACISRKVQRVIANDYLNLFIYQQPHCSYFLQDPHKKYNILLFYTPLTLKIYLTLK